MGKRKIVRIIITGIIVANVGDALVSLYKTLEQQHYDREFQEIIDYNDLS